MNITFEPFVSTNEWLQKKKNILELGCSHHQQHTATKWQDCIFFFYGALPLSDLCSLCLVFSPPFVPIFGQFLFLSSFVIISSQPCVFSWLVPSPVLLIILFAPSFPSPYKSSVFPVSLSSLNVIPEVCTCLQRSLLSPCFTIKCVSRSSLYPRSWHPRTPWQPSCSDTSNSDHWQLTMGVIKVIIVWE